MARCRIKNCRVKLDKNNTHVFLAYDEKGLENNDFRQTGTAIKIKVCYDCAKMYMGKFYTDESEKFNQFTSEMEFKDEFQKDIFEKVIK